jgi:hypothetical protein
MSDKMNKGDADTRVCHQLTHCWIKHYFQTVGFCIDAHAICAMLGEGGR